MTEELLMEWLKIVWSRRPVAYLNQPSMLVLNAFKGHFTDTMKFRLHKMKTDLLTSQVKLHQCCNQWTYPLISPLKTGQGNNI
jgi:hypothetical protein